MTDRDGQDQRKYRRIKASFAARYCVRSPFEERLAFGEKERDVIAYDLSVGGLSLWTDYPLPIGAGIVIQFRLVKNAADGEEECSRKFELQAESCYCVRTKEKSYRVGIRFTALSPDERNFIEKSIGIE